MAAWLGDAGHKANMMNPSWTTIGVGVARSGSGPIYWTQDFGTTGASSPPPAPAPKADMQPPSVPGGLGLSASGSTLNVTWQPSGDDVGVAGYDIFLNGNRLGSVQSTTGSISGAACGTAYAVGVDAFDVAGNHSAVASATTQTTPRCIRIGAATRSPAHNSRHGGLPQRVVAVRLEWESVANRPNRDSRDPCWSSGSREFRGSLSCGSQHPTQAVLRVVARTRFPCEATVAQGSRCQSVAYHVLVDGVSRLVVKGTRAVLSGLSCGKAHTVKIVPLGVSARVSSALTLVVAAKLCSRP